MSGGEANGFAEATSRARGARAIDEFGTDVEFGPDAEPHKEASEPGTIADRASPNSRSGQDCATSLRHHRHITVGFATLGGQA